MPLQYVIAVCCAELISFSTIFANGYRDSGLQSSLSRASFPIPGFRDWEKAGIPGLQSLIETFDQLLEIVEDHSTPSHRFRFTVAAKERLVVTLHAISSYG